MNNKEFKKLDCVKPRNNDNSVIQPLIFTSKGNCNNSGLTDSAFNFSNSINSYIFEKNLLPENVTREQLHIYEHLSQKTLKLQMDSYIKSLVITNCMSAIKSSDYSELLNYFPIYHNIVSKFPDDIISKLFSCLSCIDNGFDIIKMTDKDYEENFNSDAIVKSFLVTNYVVTVLFSIVDDAVNTIYNYHELEVDDIIKKISDGAITKVCAASPKDKYTFCAIAVKNILKDILSDMVTGSLGPSITNMFINYIRTGYFMYRGLLKSDTFKEDEDDF